MLLLSRDKLNKMLKKKGLSLAKFARSCGISRQSLYNMFRGRSVLSAPMEKLLLSLGVGLEDVVKKSVTTTKVLNEAPEQIKKVRLLLENYAKKYDASLFLIGSRARGKKGITSDWDFAFYFPSVKRPDDYAVTKYRAIDAAFPYRIDVVNLNDAPGWFLQSIEEDSILLFGKIGIRDFRRAA